MFGDLVIFVTREALASSERRFFSKRLDCATHFEMTPRAPRSNPNFFIVFCCYAKCHGGSGMNERVERALDVALRKIPWCAGRTPTFGGQNSKIQNWWFKIDQKPKFKMGFLLSKREMSNGCHTFDESMMRGPWWTQHGMASHFCQFGTLWDMISKKW